MRRLAANDHAEGAAGSRSSDDALVHEAYLRLVKIGELDWHDRRRRFAVSARIMRRVLVDAARAQATSKRGGAADHVAHASTIDFDRFPSPDTDRSAELCALDEALASLAAIDPRRAQVIEMRFFGGLSVEDTAMLSQSRRKR